MPELCVLDTYAVLDTFAVLDTNLRELWYHVKRRCYVINYQTCYWIRPLDRRYYLQIYKELQILRGNSDPSFRIALKAYLPESTMGGVTACAIFLCLISRRPK